MTAAAVDRLPFAPALLEDPPAIAAAYAGWIERTGLSENTKRTYAGEVRSFLTWLAQQTRHRIDEALSDPYIRDYAVRDYRRHLLTVTKREPSGVDVAVSSVGSLYGWLGIGAAKIPAAARRRTTAPKALEADQVRDVLRAAERRGVRDLALVSLLLGTGLRVAELAALDLDDVWISARKGAVQVRAGKGDRPRTVPLNAQTRDALERWLAVRSERAGAHGPLFLSREGERLAVRSVRHVVAEIGAAAQVGKLSPHMLRHTFGTLLVRQGVDMPTVAELMGHASIDTTRIYTRPSADNVAAAVELLTIEF